VTQVAVSSLRAQESRTVVQAVLGAVSLPEARLRTIVAQAGGNPFFLEELAWHAVEQGGRDTPGAVPETVHAVLAARLDRLPSEEKRLLQTAAVIGTEVPVSLLQGIAERPEVALHQSLEHLQAAEFLHETRLFPDHAYTFKHALTHEVAYGSLLQERRQALHAQIVAVLETRASNHGNAQVDLLARHALLGQVWDKAVTYCRQAGTKAYAGAAYREAVGYWEQALEALAHLSPDRPTLEQEADVHRDLYPALLSLAQYAQMLTHLRAAEALAAGLADHRRLGLIYRSLANTLRIMQDYEAALAYSQQAHALATALGDVELQLESRLAMGWISHDLGDYRQALEHLQQALTALQGAPRGQPFGLAGRLGLSPGHRLGNRTLITRAWIVSCLSQLGAFADGVACGTEMLQHAEAVDRPFDSLHVYQCMGYLHMRQGTLHQAIPLLERCVALSQEADIPNFYHSAATYLALAYALAGRATDALPLLPTDALPLLGQIERYPVVCGEAYLRAGKVEEADRLAQRGLANARERDRRGEEAWALWLLGEIAMHRDQPDLAQAAARYQQALALAEELGMRPLQAHCHRGLGMLYAATGQWEQARTALTTAITMYRGMDMTLWLSETEAALAQVA
jgi:tetratricopeptide (TPR) repeat protein